MQQLNTTALVDEMEASRHTVETPAPEAQTALQAVPQPAGVSLYDDEAAKRHGRIAAKSLAIGYKGLVRDDLDGDIRDTIGDAMGEVFTAASRAGSRMMYWAVLGLALAPLLAVMVSKAMETMKEEKKDV